MKHKKELIALHFGKQLMGDMYEMVQDWAIKYDLSIEDATNSCYKYMVWSLSEVNNNWQSHFDIMFSDIYKCLVAAPDVIFDVTDLNSFKTPTLLLQSKYVTERFTGNQHLITNESVSSFGDAFEKEFGLEFLGFESIQVENSLSVSPIKNDYRSRPRNSVIYLISDKPHYYDGKRFLPVMSPPTSDKVQ